MIVWLLKGIDENNESVCPCVTSNLDVVRYFVKHTNEVDITRLPFTNKAPKEHK